MAKRAAPPRARRRHHQSHLLWCPVPTHRLPPRCCCCCCGCCSLNGTRLLRAAPCMACARPEVAGQSDFVVPSSLSQTRAHACIYLYLISHHASGRPAEATIHPDTSGQNMWTRHSRIWLGRQHCCTSGALTTRSPSTVNSSETFSISGRQACSPAHSPGDTQYASCGAHAWLRTRLPRGPSQILEFSHPQRSVSCTSPASGPISDL